MNPIDEINEKVDEIENEKEEKSDNKTIDNSDALAHEKRKENEFNVEGNTAQFQIFVQNLSNLNAFNPNANTVNIKSNSKESYNLCNLEECIAFIEGYKDGEYLAIAIILSAFEVVFLGDLPDLKSSLMEYIPRIKPPEKENAEKYISQNDPYLSLNSIIAVIGGKRFVVESDQQYVGLGENSKQALLNIWEQFPDLRTSIISWLIHINKIHEYRTTFDIYQMATAFARIISLDFIDAQKRIFPQMYSNANNAGLLGILAYKLYESVELNHNMNTLLLEWIHSDSNWLWKSACLTYLYFLDDNKVFSLESSLKKVIWKKLQYLNRNNIKFIAILMSRAKEFRLMCASILSTSFIRADSREKKISIANIYIELVRRSYYLVNKTFIELPLVSCDTKEQQRCLLPIITQVMSTYQLRKQLYIILEAYIKELSNYQFSTSVINHLAGYFYSMFINCIEYQQDVLTFLRRCQCKVAQQIYERLSHLFKQRIGEYSDE